MIYIGNPRTSEDETLLGLGQVCEGIEGVCLLPCLEGITPAISISYEVMLLLFWQFLTNNNYRSLPDINTDPFTSTTIEIEEVRGSMYDAEPLRCYGGYIIRGYPHPGQIIFGEVINGQRKK